jgi:hypothetical protein
MEMLAGMEALGVQVCDFPFDKDSNFNYNFHYLIDEFQPHLLLTVKGQGVAPDLVDYARKKGVLTAVWFEHIDREIGPWMLELGRVHHILFTTVGGLVEKWSGYGIENSHLLMQAFQPEIYFPSGKIPSIMGNGEFILFTGKIHGRYLRRAKILDKVVRKGYPVKWYADKLPWTWKHLGFKLKYWRLCPCHQGKTIFLTDLAHEITQARLVLGIQLYPDVYLCLSNRIWNVLGCGGFYMGEYVPGQEEYFQTGVDLESFTTTEELLEKIAFYWDKPELRRQIATSGQKKVWENHTYAHRFREMFRIIAKSYPNFKSFLI